MQWIKLIIKIGSKALPHLDGNGKIPGGIPHLRHHRDDGLNTDGEGEPAKNSEWSTYSWNESHKEFGAKVTVIKFGNSQRSLLSPTGGVKSIPPTTENWLRKMYKDSMKNDTSTEDKHETNHINNKCNDMNMNTRTMHNIWAWTQARTLSHLMLGHMYLMAQVFLSLISSAQTSMCVSLWVHLSPLLLRSVLHRPLLFLTSPALRAAHWARQPDRHAKPAHLREQGE